MTPAHEQQLIMEQIISYKNARGDFSMKLATDSLQTMDPSK